MKNFYIAAFVVFVSFFFSSCTDNSLDELVENNEKTQIQKRFIDKDQIENPKDKDKS